MSFQPHAPARRRTGQGRAQRGGAKCREPLTRRDLEHAGAGRARQHDGFGLQACAAIGVASSHPLIAISRATRDPGKRSTRQTAPLEPALWRPPRSTQETAADGRKPHQVAVALEQLGRPSITDLGRLRSREKRPESRANTRPAPFGRNDNCGFSVQATAARLRARCAWRPVADRFAPP